MSVASKPWSAAALLMAAAIGIYIVGVTWFARSEAEAPLRRHLVCGLAILLGGITLLLPLPTMRAAAGELVVIDPTRWRLFLLLFGSLVASRCLAAILDPTPWKTQVAVKNAILSLIVLNAGICFLAVGPVFALALLTLLIPAMLLGRFVYST